MGERANSSAPLCTVLPAQQHIALFIWRLDYAGIAGLIVSSFFPIVYYSFMCTPHLTLLYLGSICVLGAGCVAMSLLEVRCAVLAEGGEERGSDRV
jgi:predicted membrane channel-forming protein YqfA (hemolysin III family)